MTSREPAAGLEAYLGAVIEAIRITDTANIANFSANTPQHAAPWFGRVDIAEYATVGLNPAPKEFQQGRWPAAALPIPDHLNRLMHYFVNPTVPYYGSWFDAWERALQCIGHSYFSDTVHLDLSPRATIPFSSVPDRARFIEMVASDIKWFYALLARMTQIRGLLVAGSSWGATKAGNIGAVHLDRIVRETAPIYGFALSPGKIRQRAGTRIASFTLTRPCGDQIPVFFCGASPSSNTTSALILAVCNRASLLKNLGF